MAVRAKMILTIPNLQIELLLDKMLNFTDQRVCGVVTDRNITSWT